MASKRMGRNWSFRGALPLLYNLFPLPLDKGKGDKGGWGY